MEIIGRISKGSKMDQIYLPKNRYGLMNGQYAVITPLETKFKEKEDFKPFFYNTKNIEPLKLMIIENIFKIIEEINPENVIITGSFLERGFKFNDIDIIAIKEENINIERLRKKIEFAIGIRAHIILISSKTLLLGLSIDPLYSLMLSKCISKKRIIFKIKRKFDYKILDFQLLKSKLLIDNFDILNGEEKYYLILNMMSIFLFIQDKKLSKEAVNGSIEREFNVKIEDIKQNMVEKNKFIKKYEIIYNKAFNMIMENLNEQK